MRWISALALALCGTMGVAEAAEGKWEGWTQLFAATPDPKDPDCPYLFAKPESNKWVLEEGGILHNDLSKGDHHGTDIATKELFKDFDLHVEFKIPEKSNSGIYLRGCIEIQVFDSYGKEEAGKQDMGALYNKIAPAINASGKPGEWQTMDFKLAGDKLTVTLNGKVIHDNVTVENTPGQFAELPFYKGKYKGTNAAGPGPLMIQGNHGVIELRNVYIKPTP